VSSAVLDASALLALLQDEPGAEVVATALPDACVSAVNLAEVVTKLNEAGVPAPDVRDVVEALALEVVPFEEEAAYRVGSLRPATRRAGLSLGDRACLALAAARKAPAWTTDRAWKRLKIDVEVRLIRPKPG
jgi:PIN domain nuclease of toxin-antitoxin system